MRFTLLCRHELLESRTTSATVSQLQKAAGALYRKRSRSTPHPVLERTFPAEGLRDRSTPERGQLLAKYGQSCPSSTRWHKFLRGCTPARSDLSPERHYH